MTPPAVSAHPKGLDLEKQKNLTPGPPYDPQGLMNKPGLKIMHIPDIDFRANVYTFQQELAILKSWSDAHNVICRYRSR